MKPAPRRLPEHRTGHRARALLLALIAALPAVAAAQDETVRKAAVFGRVVDTDGAPVVGATVELVRGSDDTLPPELLLQHAPSEMVVVRATESGRGGRFVLAVEPGRPFGVVARRGDDEVSPFYAHVAPGQSLTIELWPLVDREIRVARQHADGVRVPAPQARVSVAVAPRHQNPVPNRFAGLRPVSRDLIPDADGRCTMRVAKNASATVIARTGLDAAWSVSEPGQERVELVLDGGIVRGRVLDEDDRPVVGARVHRGWVRLGEPARRTDDQGRFTLRCSKRTTIVCVEPERRLPTVGVVRAGDDEVVLRARSGRRLTGRILRADGSPLANTRVFVHGVADGENVRFPVALKTRTDVDGGVDVHGLPSKSVTSVFVEADGTWVHVFHGVAGADVELGDVRVATDGRVRGVVLGPDGTPAPFAAVVLQPPQAPGVGRDDRSPPISVRFVFADHAGRFEVDGLRHAEYRIATFTSDSLPTVATVDARPGSDPVELTLVAAETIRGVVFDAHGEPAAGVQVQATPAGDIPEHGEFGIHGGCAITDGAGRFEVACYTGGEHAVFAFTVTGVSARAGSVEPGATDVRIDLTGR